MGLFKKKADPISERARALNDQIADLESQIAQIADKLQSQAEEPPAPPPKPEKLPEPPAPPQHLPGQPRFLSTAFPHSQVVVHSGAAADPVFEEVPNNPFKTNGDEAPPEPPNDLGVRKGTLSEMWRRMQNHFRPPPAANPKLVSYLAAGSIQGLRPLRYEKRVARNRTIALIIILALVVWGLLAVFLKR